MREQITAAIQHAQNLQEVETLFIELCRQLKTSQKKQSLGYVAGIIFSEGPEFVQRNLAALEKYTEQVKQNAQFPVFSAVDVFYDEDIYSRLEESKLPTPQRRERFITFWREILSCGYITDIFMTPRWELSEGATDELNTAKKMNLVIHYL